MKNQFGKLFYIIAVGASLIGLLTRCTSSEKVEEVKPNVFLIFTDDQIYSSIRALGNDEIHTPNMDRFVAEGTTFNNAFNMGGWNGAICTASRSMMQLQSTYDDPLDLSQQFLRLTVNN